MVYWAWKVIKLYLNQQSLDVYWLLDIEKKVKLLIISRNFQLLEKVGKLLNDQKINKLIRLHVL